MFLLLCVALLCVSLFRVLFFVFIVVDRVCVYWCLVSHVLFWVSSCVYLCLSMLSVYVFGVLGCILFVVYECVSDCRYMCRVVFC